MMRRSRALFLLAPAAVALLAAGCSPQDAVDRTDYGAPAGDDHSSEEEDRTRAMERMADDMNADLQEAIEDADSEQDLERAYQEFEASRQELNDLSESDEFDDSDGFDDSGEFDDSDEYAPEP